MLTHIVLLACTGAIAPPPASVPDPRLQQLLFDPPKPGPSGRTDRRWLGADCATSMALPGNTTLWLFGDTLVSGFYGGVRNESGCAMPHQTVALQRDPSAALAFAWREDANDGDRALNMFRPSNESMERSVAWRPAGGSGRLA